jgi:hypothetical protein
MKRIDAATLDLVTGCQSFPVCDLLNTSGHPVTLHMEGQRIAMAPGASQGVVQGERFSVSSRGRKTYSGTCGVVQPMGIAPDNFPHKR